jgi:hypothetical protein
MKRRVPNIGRLVTGYNDLCDKMAVLQKRKGTNQHFNAVLPKKINEKGVYKLDVDDDIWLDTGLAEEDELIGTLEPWLVDEEVRLGIRLQLEVDRCHEEKLRLIGEREALQIWFREEWSAVNSALIKAACHGEEVKVYHFNHLLKNLSRTCAMWRRGVSQIPVGHDFKNQDDWGPSDLILRESSKQLRAVIIPPTTDSRDMSEHQEDSFEYDGEEVLEVENTLDSGDDQFLVELEQVDFADAHKDDDEGNWNATYHPIPNVSVKIKSNLQKRRRVE